MVNFVDTANDKMIITYANPHQNGVVYSDEAVGATTVSEIVGDADALIESGERWKISVDFASVGALADFTADGTEYTSEYENFRIEVRPATGSVLTIERVLPAVNENIMVIE